MNDRSNMYEKMISKKSGIFPSFQPSRSYGKIFKESSKCQQRTPTYIPKNDGMEFGGIFNNAGVCCILSKNSTICKPSPLYMGSLVSNIEEFVEDVSLQFPIYGEPSNDVFFKKNKRVYFCNSINIKFIENREFYMKNDLKDVLWWNANEYMKFREDASIEITVYKIKNGLNTNDNRLIGRIIWSDIQ